MTMSRATADALLIESAKQNTILASIAELLRAQASAHDQQTVLLKQIKDALVNGGRGSGLGVYSLTPPPGL